MSLSQNKGDTIDNIQDDTTTLKADTTTLKADTTTLKADTTTLKAYHVIPLTNSTDNTLMRDAVGNKNDEVGVPYSFNDNSILAHLNTIYYHIHGQAFVYPDHADAVQLTSGAGAWNLTGAIVEVIPAGALNVADFDLHWINIADISANAAVQIDIFAGEIGSEIRIGATRSQRNAVQSRENANRIQIPQQTVGTRISCRLSDGTAGSITLNVSFEGHYYG